MSSDAEVVAESPQVPPTAVSPDAWAQMLSGPADLSSRREHWPKALLRHWTGTSPRMEQPPLDHHYIVQHLGGAKQVERRRDGAPVSTVVACGALTVVPAGTEFRWHTRGPIEFAHLYLCPSALAVTAARFDQTCSFSLIDRVGCRDPLLESLYAVMLEQLRRGAAASALLLDSLLETLVLRLLSGHSTRRPRAPARRELLPAFRVRRVLEFVDAHLHEDITLAGLAAVAGGSVFHFSRAFHNAVGEAPYHYVLQRRIERARSLLAEGVDPVAVVARQCGFTSVSQFSRAFSGAVGVSPSRYRGLLV